jgi:formylglycine-generating enzyme required for sulfatase activity
MKRVLRHPLGWVLALAALASVLFSEPAASAPEKVPDKLPHVEPLKEKGYTQAIPGSEVKFEMVALPGGTFLMGSPKGEAGRAEDEGPQHPVTVRPFWMGKTEVTWDEYDLFWRDNPGNKQDQMKAEKAGLAQKELDALSRPTPPYADETFGYGREGQPVLSMTHHAAMEYCRWLSQKTGKAYRLPTEAEWEWACRAGSSSAYGFGDDPKALADHAWFHENGEDTPHKVAEKKPNAWGLYDMHGNVSEWCLDHYKKDTYGARPLDKATPQPVHAPTAERYPHVIRGGSWADKAPGLRSAARRPSDKVWNRQDPQIPRSIWWLTDADFVGFRVVCAAEEHPDLKGLRSKVKWDSK